MVRFLLTMVISIAVSGIDAVAQPQTVPPDERYVFVETPSRGFGGGFGRLLTNGLAPGSADVSKVREKLVEAGRQGCEVQFLASRSGSLDMLLKHDEAGPREYQLIATRDDEEFIEQLNEAVTHGFRLVTGAAKIYNESADSPIGGQWMAVLVEQPDSPAFSYYLIKGTNQDAEQRIADAMSQGAVLAASFGDGPVAQLALLFGTPREGDAAATGILSAEYKIIATNLTGTLEGEVQEAAAEGFGVLGTGATTVVMERVSSDKATLEYKLLSTKRRKTLERELRAAGAEGYRPTFAPEHRSEWMLLLERDPSDSNSLDYSVVELKEKNVNKTLSRLEQDGYRVVHLLDKHAVFERSGQ